MQVYTAEPATDKIMEPLVCCMHVFSKGERLASEERTIAVQFRRIPDTPDDDSYLLLVNMPCDVAGCSLLSVCCPSSCLLSSRRSSVSVFEWSLSQSGSDESEIDRSMGAGEGGMSSWFRRTPVFLEPTVFLGGGPLSDGLLFLNLFDCLGSTAAGGGGGGGDDGARP